MQESDLKFLKDVMQSANISFLIGSGLSLPYLKTLGSIERKLTELSSRDGIDKDVLLLVRNSLFYKYFNEVMYPNKCVSVDVLLPIK